MGAPRQVTKCVFQEMAMLASWGRTEGTQEENDATAFLGKKVTSIRPKTSSKGIALLTIRRSLAHQSERCSPRSFFNLRQSKTSATTHSNNLIGLILTRIRYLGYFQISIAVVVSSLQFALPPLCSVFLCLLFCNPVLTRDGARV